jgi:hypothetical protein
MKYYKCTVVCLKSIIAVKSGEKMTFIFPLARFSGLGIVSKWETKKHKLDLLQLNLAKNMFYFLVG